MAQINLRKMPQLVGWDTFSHSHMSVVKLCLAYALPLSVVPPAMLYYAGVTYGAGLSATQLQFVGAVLFIAELVMTFVVAYVIQSLGEVIDIKPAFEDCYKLAVVVPTPLWIAPLFLYIPSFMLNVTVVAAALILSGILIYYSVPAVLKVEEKGHAILLAGSILAAGAVAWAVMMYITLLTWGFATSTLLLMI